MKIGILTFHWATNYGAVLQCYALQEYLRSSGHDVEIVNYKPHQYWQFISKIRHLRNIKQLFEITESYKKEKSLSIFRKEKLRLTKRVFKTNQIAQKVKGLDAVISGSDQVLSPSFLMNGDGKNKLTLAYYLGFPFNGLKITYAASFGCTEYPEQNIDFVKKAVKELDSISVRELSGVSIFKTIGIRDAVVVPDPTLLQPGAFYQQLVKSRKVGQYPEKYVYSFFIRNISERRTNIESIDCHYDIIWNNDDKDYTLEGWLAKIANSKFVITDSFHCVMMCLKFHVPFAVVTEKKGNVGMNDRLYTILGTLALTKHIFFKNDIHRIPNLFDIEIDWNYIEMKLTEIREIGERFLRDSLSE